MKKRNVLIILLLFLHFSIFAQNWTTLSYSPDQPGLENNPLKGFATLWNPSNNFPHSIQGHLFGLDDVMSGMNTFNWTVIDNAISNDASKGNFSYIQVNIDPAKPGITDMPKFIIDQVDWKETPENLCPDWNNEILIQAMLNLISAYGQKYNNDSRVFLVHFGLYGMWGEWHVGEYGGDFAMSSANQQRISDAYLKAFPKKQLLARYPTLPDNEVVGYSDGLFFGQSIHADNPWFFHNTLKTNNADQNWKLHAIGGEIDPGLQTNIWKSWPNTVGQDVTKCLDAIHPTWLFSHHVLTMSSKPGSAEWTNAIRVQKMLGYTFFISKNKLTAANGKVTVELGIQNKGIAPIYANWNVEIGILDSNKKFQIIGKTKCNLDIILPGQKDDYRAISATDSINDGMYKVLLRVVNPMEGYSSNAQPLRFANESQDADKIGWLTLGEMMISNGACGNTPIRVSRLTISPDTITLSVGETLQLTSYVIPSEASYKSISWISDHPATAMVDSDGIVTAGPLMGQAKITAVTQDGCFESRSTIKVEPLWANIPGKIEAENFTKQSGIQTENCSDVGNGLNVGWIDSGDWLQYPVNNYSDSIYFSASFRSSSPNNGGIITLFLDNSKIGELSVPNTGSWQNWKSVSTIVNIGKGKHYLKVVATSGGFNINYMEFELSAASRINQYQNNNIMVYPLPARDHITIKSGDWLFDKINIVDLTGKIVFSKQVPLGTKIDLPIHIQYGIYILQLRGRDNAISNRLIVIE